MEDPARSDLDLAVVAASLRLGRENLDDYLDALSDRLAAAIPSRVKVNRSRQGLKKRVSTVTVDFGDNTYTLERTADSLTARCSQRIKGITLRTDEIPVDDWLEQVSHNLVGLAAHNLEVKVALERLRP